MDTLNELATALGDDPNFATTVTNALATKLPLSGGAMTGDLNINSQKIFSTDAVLIKSISDVVKMINQNDFSLSHNISALTSGRLISWRDKAITPAGLDDIKNNYFFACSDEDSDLLVDVVNAVYTDYIPYAITVSSIIISANTAPTGDSIEVDIHKNGTTIFTTVISIDASENTSLTAATPYILDGAISFSQGDKIEAFITQVGSIIAGAGLKVKILD